MATFALALMLSAVPSTEPLSGQITPGSALARLDSIFADLNRTDSPGCALGVEEAGRLAIARGYGMADLDQGTPIRANTVFRIGSVAKQFTAASIVMLEMDGRLSIDDPFRQHIPEIADFGEPLTLRHVLNHTSGLRDWLGLMSLSGMGSNLYTRDDVLDLVSRQDELNFPTGSRYLYSNSGFLLLTDVVRRTTDRSMRDFAQERLFAPLGMTSTRFHDDPDEIVERRATGYAPHPDGGFRISMSPLDVVGAGGLLTTIEDFAKWSRNLADPQVGGAGFVDRLLRQGVLSNGDTIGYALGISHGEMRGLRTLGHGGSWAGYRADFLRFPDEDLSIMVFCNLSTANPGARARRVAAVLLEDRMEPALAAESGPGAESAADEATVTVAPARLRTFEGDYRSPELGVTYRIRIDGEELHLLEPTPLAGELIPTGEAEFRRGGNTFRFIGTGQDAPRELRVDAGRVLNLRFHRVDN